MRRISSKNDKQDKEFRKRRIIVLTMAGLMILSVVGYGFIGFSRNNNERKKDYNGVEFILDEAGWYFELYGVGFMTLYTPDETRNISSDISLSINDYVGKPLYFSSDSPSNVVQEIERNLYSVVPRSQLACLEEGCDTYPVKNCSDNIIIISEGNETFIKQEENCIFITARADEQYRASDQFLFKILGIV